METPVVDFNYKKQTTKTYSQYFISGLICALLLLMCSVPLSFATILQCKDPATGKITFTNKPCPTAHEVSVLNGKGEKPSPYVDYSLPALQSHLLKREKELADAYAFLGFTNKDTKDFIKYHNTGKLERKAWQENRDTRCLQKFLESGKQGEAAQNKDFLICKIQITEEKLSTFTNMTSTGQAVNIATENVRVTLLPGKAGLQAAVQQGLIEPASPMDIQIWLDAADVREQSDFFRVSNKYVIRKLVTFSGGLGGANLALFLVPDSTLAPSGDYGASCLLFMETGACIGPICSEIKQ